MVAQGGGDICEEFSSRMPIRVFNAWMNLQPEQAAQLAEVGRRYNIAVQSNDEVATKETSLKLYEMARAVLAERKARPLPVDQDATSALLAARVDGQPLPEEMIVGTIRQVLVVGIIAPTVMIGSIAVHLSRDQKLQQHLREHPELSEAATEEFLRLYTPYRGFARTARTRRDAARPHHSGRRAHRAGVCLGQSRRGCLRGCRELPPRPAEHEGIRGLRPRSAHVPRRAAGAARDARRAGRTAGATPRGFTLAGNIVPDALSGIRRIAGATEIRLKSGRARGAMNSGESDMRKASRVGRAALSSLAALLTLSAWGAAPDISGTWLPVESLSTAWPEPLPLTEAARARYAAFDPDRDEPASFCMPLGTPRNTLSGTSAARGAAGR